MKLKILLLVSAMGPGGAERVASTLANTWVGRGDQVILMPTFSGHGECFYQLSSGVHLVYLADLVSSRARTCINRLYRFFSLRRFITTEHPDVIISFLADVNLPAIIASFGLGIPIIVCERIDSFVTPSSYLKKLMCRFTYPLADALMVQTQAVAIKYTSLGWKLKRIQVIPNPVSEQILNTHYQANQIQKKRILSVGRLEDQKQFSVLIKIFAGLVKSHPGWKLCIIGEGSLRETLKKQIAELKLNSHIELSGQKENINQELVKADIFALTSKYEGFPNALLEAMAVGLPCVAFDCPSGPREMSMDGKIALLVPLNNERVFGIALERLMLDAGLRASLGAQARASVIERFSLDKILEQWDLLIKEVTSK